MSSISGTYGMFNTGTTSAYLGRVARTSGDLSEVDDNLANEQAIDEIVELNLVGIYRKVVRDV